MTDAKILQAGDSCLFVEFGTTIDRAVNARVQSLRRALEENPPAGLVELVPTYRSLAVYFDPLRVDAAALRARLESAAAKIGEGKCSTGDTVRVPVCFGGEFGPDLDDVAAHTGLSADEVVRLYCASPLYCYMNGFTPGFPYLGGMDERLATPRLKTPRTLIPAGSVAIGGAQAGAYPQASPGGWRIIGRVPFPLYDASREPAAAIRAGMNVRFYPVTRDRYDEIARGPYEIEYGEALA